MDRKPASYTGGSWRQSEADAQGRSHLAFQTETINEVPVNAESVRDSDDTVCSTGIGVVAKGPQQSSGLKDCAL
jgi:hypothetical protein